MLTFKTDVGITISYISRTLKMLLFKLKLLENPLIYRICKLPLCLHLKAFWIKSDVTRLILGACKIKIGGAKVFREEPLSGTMMARGLCSEEAQSALRQNPRISQKI